MSGPKVVVLSESQIASRRGANRRQCAPGMSELKRLLRRGEEIAAQLQEIGCAALRCDVDYDAVANQMETLLAQRTGDAAPAHVSNAVNMARNAVIRNEQTYAKEVASLQHRALQLAGKQRRLAGEIHAVGAAAAAATPADWPGKERAAILKLAETLCGKIPAPAKFRLELSKKSIREMEKVEAETDRGLAALNGVREKLAEAVNDAHRRVLGAKLASRAAPAIKLSDLMPKPVVADPVAQAADDYAAKVQELLVGVACLRDLPGWAEIQERADLISQEKDPGRRRIRYEDLAIFCSKHIRRNKEVDAWRQEIDALIDGAARSGGEAVGKIIEELQAMSRSGSRESLAPVKRRLTAAMAEQDVAEARERRRKAVVGALVDLGYEISGDISTALVKGGELVVQKPSDEDYALSVAVDNDLQMVQTALVRYGTDLESTAQQRLEDKEKEEAWCLDHAKLLKKLEAQGFESKFLKKEPAGKNKMRVVVDAGRDDRRRRGAVGKLKEQKLRR